MVSAWSIYACSGAAIIALSLYGVFACAPLLKRILAANLIGTGVFLILVALADRSAPAQPDPVPHALVLTGVVISVSATALALAIAIRLADRRSSDDEGGWP